MLNNLFKSKNTIKFNNITDTNIIFINQIIVIYFISYHVG